MSAYVSTCRHISAHAGIYTGGDTCHYPSKVQMTGIRGAESDVRYWHMPARVSILAHVSTCRHVSRSWHITAHTRMSVHEQASKIRSKSLVSDLPSVMLYVGTCQHMSVHVGMFPGVDTCQHIKGCPHLNKVEVMVSQLLRVSAHVGMFAEVNTCWYGPAPVCRHPDCDILSSFGIVLSSAVLSSIMNAE